MYTHVEVKGQLVGISSLHMAPRDWTQVIGLWGRHLYMLNHLVSPLFYFLNVLPDSTLVEEMPWVSMKQPPSMLPQRVTPVH